VRPDKPSTAATDVSDDGDVGTGPNQPRRCVTTTVMVIGGTISEGQSLVVKFATRPNTCRGRIGALNTARVSPTEPRRRPIRGICCYQLHDELLQNNPSAAARLVEGLPFHRGPHLSPSKALAGQ
jgi:hypothetical protein